MNTATGSAAAAAPFSGVDAAALLSALPDPTVWVSAGGEFVLNAAARERLGAVDGQTQNWTALFLPDAAQALRDATALAVMGTPSRLSVTMPGAVAPALATVTPAGPGAALLHFRESHDPLEVALDIMDRMGLGMTVQGADTQILHANAAAATILGLSPDQLTGRDSLDPRWRAIHPNGKSFPGETHPAIVALKTGQPLLDVPMGVYHPAAEQWRWLKVTAIPRRAPGLAQPEQVTTIFADVTAQRHTSEELSRSEQRFRSLVEATAQIVFTTDKLGNFSGPQPDWEAFTGQDAEQALNPAVAIEAIHPEDRDQTLRGWAEALKSGQPHDIEHRLRRRDGVYVPMQIRAVPLRSADGSVREWIGAYTDVSAMRGAEAALRALNAELEGRVAVRTQELAEVTRFSTLLLTAAGEGVFGLDASGRTTFANPAAARLLGYSVERLIGSQQHALIHHSRADGTPYPVEECPVHQTLRDGQTRRLDHDVLWHAQGHAVPVASVVTPLFSAAGTVTGAVLMVQDIAERLRAQSQLQEAIEDLERSNTDLEQFAYVASHDLQEPLRTLGSYAELLGRRYEGQLDDRADRYLGFMQDAVGRMRGLIQDLLEFSRVGRGESVPTALNLDDAMRAAADSVGAALHSNIDENDEEGGDSLSWDTPDTVLAHAPLIAPLLTNLIGNALKFTAPGQPARVRVESRQDGEMVYITVQDNGIGIALEYQERVFDIFQRLHRREDYAGNGMGLAICRKIVEHHGGTLWLESTPLPAPDHGTTFHFTLPAAAQSLDSHPPDPDSHPSDAGPAPTTDPHHA
ncbi:PAS domain S-box protein [Deinococcus sp. AJ005]|uniref:PAS domain-containing sensor histidine kinase n=1 Tax=Deinococcus sp. AJ005 TaxID=2652443 RepID=UPI00125CB2B5|nr:PAS domain S-box protein [Deinococcus sp. AJ005]QFP75577.1 PAS domain S-box protein [Deinococcus sp. AJ005]